MDVQKQERRETRKVLLKVEGRKGEIDSLSPRSPFEFQAKLNLFLPSFLPCSSPPNHHPWKTFNHLQDVLPFNHLSDRSSTRSRSTPPLLLFFPRFDVFSPPFVLLLLVFFFYAPSFFLNILRKELRRIRSWKRTQFSIFHLRTSFSLAHQVLFLPSSLSVSSTLLPPPPPPLDLSAPVANPARVVPL